MEENYNETNTKKLLTNHSTLKQKQIPEKKKLGRPKHPFKNKDVYAYALGKLREGWSPEQIAGRLKRNHPNDGYWHITHETIYQFIYHPDNQDKKFWEYLRRKQKKRRKRNGRKAQRIRIPNRVFIHKRPKIVEKRIMIGHWEGDSLVGKGRRNGLHTTYERVSSLIRMEKMARLTSDESIKAQKRIYTHLPPSLRKSTTLDNGVEYVKHGNLKKDLDMQTYFADPYSAWQRGGNENANLWIRYYFPKGTDFSKISKEELEDVEWELNHRPRKRLDFETPAEVFTGHVKECSHR